MIVCGACGHENPDTSEFCVSCGRFLEYTRRPDPGQPDARAPERPAPPPPGPQTFREPLVTVSPPFGPANPGESLLITARIRNASSIVDRVSLTVVGPSAAWWKVEPASVSLYPGMEAEIRLELRPPKGPDLPAGPTPVGLRAQTDPPDVRMATAEFEVVVAARPDVTTELIPRTSRGRRTGRHTLTLTNGGNAPWPATVRAVDPDARLRLRVQPETVEVAAGTRANVAIVAGGEFNVVGPTDVTPFTVEVRPLDGGPPITHEARFEQSSLFRTIPLAVAGGLAAVMIVVVAALAGWVKLPPQASPTPSASGPSPTAVISASPRTEEPTATLQQSPATPTPPPTPTPTPAVAEWATAVAADMGFGPPVGITEPTSDGLGQVQRFADGVVYLRPDGKAVPIFGAILQRWMCMLDGAEGSGCYGIGAMPPVVSQDLGYPVEREGELSTGEPYQAFDNGGLYCHKECAWVVFEPVYQLWQTFRAPLGLPIRNVVLTNQFGNAWLGRFDEGFLMTTQDGAEWFVCGNDGSTIGSSGLQTDCVGWAAYVKSRGD